MAKKIRIKLDKVLDDKGLSQKQLKQKIDDKYYNGENKFRAAALSEIYNNQRKSINREHLEMIINTLNLTSIDQLIEIVEE